MSAQHTPTPWVMTRSVDRHDGEFDYGIHARDAKVLAEVFGRSASGGVLPAEANAAFIVRACNAHEDLVAALKIASGYVSSHLGHLQAQEVTGPALDKTLADYEATLAALAKAEAP